ncbi:hypothetical protein EXE58_15245 [Nocardioides seonyuensis]|uniref:WD40 repeat domain-containing protein n=1 Tax=Nocardioides seonyuensis TaxID=2518371 RepID=A0A4P7IKY6_9ACTN|nr:hypothetical protein [Nocardioides seonyuensis]QBX56681.1 hypothetical protein EXE58_15245 [Nocardioides seonyuensis]
MKDHELADVLARASDHVVAPDLAGTAWAAAERRRRGRRAGLACIAASLVLVGGAVALHVGDRNERVGPAETPSPVPSTSSDPVDSDDATQPVWDPFTLTEAPMRASVLPTDLDPPTIAPSIQEQPLPDIVVAWPEEGADLRVLGSDQQWRSVPGTADAISRSLRDVVDPAISPDGARVAMSTDAGILVVEANGGRSVISWPPALEGPFDTRPRLLWLPGDEGFVVLHWKRPWLVDLDGKGAPAPFGGMYGGGVMVDPDTGTVRDRAEAYGALRTWNDHDDASSVILGGYGERFVTRFGLVAYTGNPGSGGFGVPRSGPVVVDPASGEVLAFAPIRDRNSVYSDNGHLTALGFLDEATVLLMVRPMDFRTMEPEEGVSHLVAWTYETGEFEVLSRGDRDLRLAAFAPALIGNR